MIARSRLVLPTPLRPEQARDRTRFGADGNATQGDRGAIVQIYGGNFEHHQRPRYTSITRGSPLTWSMEPSEIDGSFVQHRHLDAEGADEAMSCSTTTTLRVRLISRSSCGGLLGLGVGHAGDRLVHQQ